MLRSLLEGARSTSRPDRIHCRLCAVIDSVSKIPYDGSMVFIKWKLNIGGVFSRFRADDSSGMTQACVVRDGTVNFGHPFVADCWLRPHDSNSVVTDHLVLTVHRLKSGSEIENVGNVIVDLVGEQQPVSQSSYLLKNSNANAIVQLTTSVDVLDIMQDTAKERSSDLCMKQVWQTPPVSVRSLKARSVSMFPTSPTLPESAKQVDRPSHRHHLSTTDMEIVCKLLNDFVNKDD